jgi:hypothetical protein
MALASFVVASSVLGAIIGARFLFALHTQVAVVAVAGSIHAALTVGTTVAWALAHVALRPFIAFVTHALSIHALPVHATCTACLLAAVVTSEPDSTNAPLSEGFGFTPAVAVAVVGAPAGRAVHAKPAFLAFARASAFNFCAIYCFAIFLFGDATAMAGAIVVLRAERLVARISPEATVAVAAVVEALAVPAAEVGAEVHLACLALERMEAHTFIVDAIPTSVGAPVQATLQVIQHHGAIPVAEPCVAHTFRDAVMQLVKLIDLPRRGVEVQPRAGSVSAAVVFALIRCIVRFIITYRAATIIFLVLLLAGDGAA